MMGGMALFLAIVPNSYSENIMAKANTDKPGLILEIYHQDPVTKKMVLTASSERSIKSGGANHREKQPPRGPFKVINSQKSHDNILAKSNLAKSKVNTLNIKRASASNKTGTAAKPVVRPATNTKLLSEPTLPADGAVISVTVKNDAIKQAVEQQNKTMQPVNFAGQASSRAITNSNIPTDMELFSQWLVAAGFSVGVVSLVFLSRRA